MGLPDAAVRESRELIKSVTINPAPANLRNARAGFDLPMAVCARRRGILNLVLPRHTALEVLALRQQVAVLKRKRPRPPPTLSTGCSGPL